MKLENRSATDLQKRMNDGGYTDKRLPPNDPLPKPVAQSKTPVTPPAKK